MSAPLLFVCRHTPRLESAAGECTQFIALESPDGPVFQAFESHELAALLLAFYGSAANVVLLPETALTPELSARITGQRVVVFRTHADYDGATLKRPDFPWQDRVMRYNPRSVVARGVLGASDLP